VPIVTRKVVLNERMREKKRGKGREKIKKKERSMNVSHKTKRFKTLTFKYDAYMMKENIF
jgi:hypothetical protein